MTSYEIYVQNEIDLLNGKSICLTSLTCAKCAVPAQPCVGKY